VARLADYVVWLDQGRVRDRGSPEQVFSNLDFARWRGDDAGTVVKVQVKTHDPEYNVSTVASPWGELWLSGCSVPPGGHVRVRVLASDVSIARTLDPNTTIMNQLPIRIADIHESEADVLVRMVPRRGSGPGLLARVTRISRDRLELQEGTDAYAWIKAVAVLQ
jgi:molybdate transport system ATP-binding protein